MKNREINQEQVPAEIPMQPVAEASFLLRSFDKARDVFLHANTLSLAVVATGAIAISGASASARTSEPRLNFPNSPRLDEADVPINTLGPTSRNKLNELERRCPDPLFIGVNTGTTSDKSPFGSMKLEKINGGKRLRFSALLKPDTEICKLKEGGNAIVVNRFDYKTIYNPTGVHFGKKRKDGLRPITYVDPYPKSNPKSASGFRIFTR